MLKFSSVHFSRSVMLELLRRSVVTPRITTRQASLSINNSWSLLKHMSIESMMPSNHLILCCPLLLLLSIFPSIRVFSKWVSSLHQEAKVLKFQLQHQSFQWIFRNYFLWNGLVGFPCCPRDFQGSSNHSSKASILQCSAFFMVQLSHPYMTTGETIILTRWNFVGKVISLLFKMLPRLVITFLPRSKCLLISWLQSPSVVILEPHKMKSVSNA